MEGKMDQRKGDLFFLFYSILKFLSIELKYISHLQANMATQDINQYLNNIVQDNGNVEISSVYLY